MSMFKPGQSFSDAELERLFAEAEARFAALTPEQQAAHRQAQAESWARGMAPCEHGVADWETCPDCRKAHA